MRTNLKIAFALSGLIVFGLGIRWDSLTMRWTGLGFVVVAWLLRFLKSPPGAR